MGTSAPAVINAVIEDPRQHTLEEVEHLFRVYKETALADLLGARP